VVRLKGGDPFVFGRGGEEAMALRRARVRYDVVPGITSSVAAPAAAGVPVTHRGVAASFTVVTGHRRAGEPDIDWRALARVGGTIVVLMGVARRAEIATRLIAGGMDPATPVAAVQSATTDRQVVGRCPLSALADLGVRSPAVLVIGAVAALELAGATGDSVAAVSQGTVRYPAPMDETTTVTVDDDPEAADELLDDELLVEEISIDGMCGVY
jgi:mycofactocin precursor